MTPEVKGFIKEWRDKKYESVRINREPGAILDYHVGLAEIYGEVEDGEHLKECIVDLYGKNGINWEYFIEQIGEESEAHVEFRERLNAIAGVGDIIESLYEPTEPLS